VHDLLIHIADNVVRRWEWEETHGVHDHPESGSMAEDAIIRLTRSSSFRNQLKSAGCCQA
jgi:hypothetical protein